MQRADKEKVPRRGCFLRGLSLFGKAIWILALLEGACSLLGFIGAFALVGGRRAESLHVQHDEELGWRHQENFARPHMYGEGLSLFINGQGFRNNEEFTQDVPPERVRIVCSGDSFTLGFGVRGEQVWHQLLTNHNAALQVVNMGQAGYGVDQSYLWYLRDGVKLDHDLHIFAFITDDFERARYPFLFADAKPMLSLRDGRPVAVHVPISPKGCWPPKNVAVTYGMSRLATVRVAKRLGLDLLKGVNVREPGSGLTNRELKPTLSAMWRELRAVNERRGSRMVLVHLPTQQDHPELDMPHQWRVQTDWRRFIREEAEREGYRFIDLVEGFARMPVDDAEELFLQRGEVRFALAEGHYNVKGNQYIADQLYQRLTAMDDIRNVLEEAADE